MSETTGTQTHHPHDHELVYAVAQRWWDQDPEAWRQDGKDSPNDLRKDVGQVLRCLHEEQLARAKARAAQFHAATDKEKTP